MRRQFSKWVSPFSVSRTMRVVRVSSRTPRCSSSSVTMRLTTDGDTSSLRAAAENPPVSATVTKVVIACSRSMLLLREVVTLCRLRTDGQINRHLARLHDEIVDFLDFRRVDGEFRFEVRREHRQRSAHFDAGQMPPRAHARPRAELQIRALFMGAARGVARMQPAVRIETLRVHEVRGVMHGRAIEKKHERAGRHEHIAHRYVFERFERTERGHRLEAAGFGADRFEHVELFQFCVVGADGVVAQASEFAVVSSPASSMVSTFAETWSSVMPESGVSRIASMASSRLRGMS